METCIQPRPKTSYAPARNRAYETTYQRSFSAIKRASTIVEGVPAGQRFLIGAPYQLTDGIGVSSYSVQFPEKKDVQREPVIRPSTPRANRPHPHLQFTHWPRQCTTETQPLSIEIKQALRNQLNSTYRTDYIGAPQGFPLPLAYNRSRAFWRNRPHHTIDSEYRRAYEQAKRSGTPVETAAGRYGFSSKVPADAIVPLTLPMWKKTPSQTTYIREISEKVPSDVYMKDFVDSLGGAMDE